ncbi:MAG: hypothetical protein SO046_10680 [Actinomyces urogenitalis]|uniref:glutathione S-transferase C-terminal domain-containing protein n=1 Tax=Actinomyces urogenitalis TaxID=103621 RepID=UPI002A8315C2|nr:glutathione S-transferase C-terminal domain-containing protein [Actinomyces urogenitalis]MDY3679658.1 hypothetical protein [Actinomyces urogenitalis]
MTSTTATSTTPSTSSSASCSLTAGPDPLAPERVVEQTPDGAFRRRTNYFTTRFGDGPGQAPVESGRYRLFVDAGCGWSRRQTIALRLLGLDEHISIGWTGGRTREGRTFNSQPGGVDPVTGARLLDDLYRATEPDYQGRATVPTVYDLKEGRVVSNDYHLLTYQWETAWKPLHKDGAPDLYPQDLRDDIDALNQQLFDDVNNGPYKVLFAQSLDAARVARGVWEARLAELDFRLASRRYLFGERLTDSDIRLFVTLASFDQGYRPSFPAEIGLSARITDFPNLWAYARDLHATPGFAIDREDRANGILPREDGTWRSAFGEPGDGKPVDGNPTERWHAPANREHLAGSPLFSGPGGAGSWEQLRGWTQDRRAELV